MRKYLSFVLSMRTIQGEEWKHDKISVIKNVHHIYKI